MTNVKFPRKEFEKYIKLTPEIIEKISLFGTPLESIDEEYIEIEIFPNRPDLISLQGFMRSFRPFLGKDTEAKKYSVSKPKENYSVKISPSVNKVRPYTACAIVTNLSLNDEKIKQIIELQEKLHFTIGRNRKKAAIGIYPLEKISLPIKYEAKNPEMIKFIPLDSDKEMTAAQILNRHPKGKEFRSIIEKEDLFPLFIDRKNKILSMPPIINSEETGKVNEKTKEVFVECSGNHFKTLSKTLNIIVTTLADMGGKIVQMNLAYPDRTIVTPEMNSEKIKISLEKTNKLLGLNIKEKELENLLNRMGYEYSNKSVSVPPWRIDILHEVDLIEDVAIAYGYNKLSPEIPKVSTIGKESEKEKFKNKIAEILVGLGMIEVSTYHLIKPREAEITQTDKKIEVENSKTEYKILRPSLTIPALRIISENKDNEYPQEIFEIGTVFSENPDEETGIEEEEKVCVLISPGNFTKAKQVLNHLSEIIGFKYEISEHESPLLIKGRTAKITINGKNTGIIGEVHPKILNAFGAKMPASLFEISLEDISK